MIRFYVGIFCVFFGASLLFSGCKAPQKITGGSARHESGGFEISYAPPSGGKVTITDNREVIATTQPSVSINGDATNFKSITAPEGEIGGFSFVTKNIPKSYTIWGLIGLLLLTAVGFYLVGNYVGAVASLACTVIAFIQPNILVFFAIAALAWLILTNWKRIKQFISGNKVALENMPPEVAEQAKVNMSTKQDEATQQLAKSVSASLKVKG